jgi:hypothetical protein
MGRDITLLDESSFTASSDDVIVSRPGTLDEMIISMKAEPTSATDITTAALLPLVQPFELKRNGVAFISIRGDDLYALNNYLLGLRPVAFASGATTDYNSRVMGLRIPVYLTRGDDTLTYKITRVAVSNADTETISLMARFLEAAPAQGWLEYTTYSYTPSASGSSLRAMDVKSTGDLIGLLIYGTTIPLTSADTTTVDKLQLRLDGEITHEATWQTLRAPTESGSVADATVPEGILDNYVFWDFRKEPIPAGKRIEVYVNAGDTNAVRMIPIFRHG